MRSLKKQSGKPLMVRRRLLRYRAVHFTRLRLRCLASAVFLQCRTVFPYVLRARNGQVCRLNTMFNNRECMQSE